MPLPPSVSEPDGEIEDRALFRRIAIDNEVALTLELEALACSSISQGGLEDGVRHNAQ
jgi:hypothetical protein